MTPQGILRSSNCKKYQVKTLIFDLFAVLEAIFFFLSNLGTLFVHLATLKRFENHCVRQMLLSDIAGPFVLQPQFHVIVNLLFCHRFLFCPKVIQVIN